MLEWIRKWRDRRADALMLERRIVVTDEDGRISAAYPDGMIKEVNWSDLQQIEIRTSESGPWGMDVWWVLKGMHGECVYPHGATGDAELIPKFRKLAGFDDTELSQALACTDNKTFVCWKSGDAT